MSANFAIFVQDKIFARHRDLADELRRWAAAHSEAIFAAKRPARTLLPRRPWPEAYRLCSLAEFGAHEEVHLDLPARYDARYRVMDWGFVFPPKHVVIGLGALLAEKYPCGEMGLLSFWLERQPTLPPIRVGESDADLARALDEGLALNQLVIGKLSQFGSPLGT